MLMMLSNLEKGPFACLCEPKPQRGIYCCHLSAFELNTCKPHILAFAILILHVPHTFSIARMHLPITYAVIHMHVLSALHIYVHTCSCTYLPTCICQSHMHSFICMCSLHSSFMCTPARAHIYRHALCAHLQICSQCHVQRIQILWSIDVQQITLLPS